MKTKIKRHSRSVLSVVLALCMLLSCMTAGMIMTDAAKVDSESVGYNTYYVKGSWDKDGNGVWILHDITSSAYEVHLEANKTYSFVFMANDDQFSSNTTIKNTTNYNFSQNNSASITLQTAAEGTYKFSCTGMDGGQTAMFTHIDFPPEDPSTITWTAVGDSTALFGTAWAPTANANDLTKGSGTTWSKTWTDVQLTNGSTIKYKVAKNHAWATAYPSSNATATVPGTSGTGTGLYNVTVTYNESGNAVKMELQNAATYTLTVGSVANAVVKATYNGTTANEGGTISNIPQGATVSVSVTPDTGYQCSGITSSGGGTTAGSLYSFTLTMPGANTTVGATLGTVTLRRIYFNNSYTLYGQVYAHVYDKNDSTKTYEYLGPYPGTTMTKLDNSNIWYIEVPSDVDYVEFTSGEGYTTGEMSIQWDKAYPKYTAPYGSYTAPTTTNGGTWGNYIYGSDNKRTNEYTVSDGSTMSASNLFTGITATMYDYYTDNEVANGWRQFANNEYSQGTNGSGWKWNPYTKLNAALSEYANDTVQPKYDVTTPLYFGNLNTWSDDGAGNAIGSAGLSDKATIEGYYNWQLNPNNSVRLNPGSTAITGLSGKTLANDTIHYYDGSDATNENGAPMAMFDEDFLSGENKEGKALATILRTSSFPVRKEENVGGTLSGISKLYLVPGGWANDNCVFDARFWNDNGFESWVPFPDSGTERAIDIPSQATKVVFVRRLSSDGHKNTWDPKERQSVDITLSKTGSNAKNVYTFDGNWGNAKSNFTATLDTTKDGCTFTGGHTYYEYDSTNGKDNAYITDISDSNKTAKINYYANNAAWSGGTDPNTQGFFPFDYANKGSLAKDLGFGMKLVIPFNLNGSGTSNGINEDGTPQTFDFSGDDDLWVFVDGKLVLDLGGAHGRTTGSINFKDKTVTATNTQANGTATRNVSFADGFNTNENYVHTMTIYYMERGMFESNLKFGFSFHAIPNQFWIDKKIRTKDIINAGFYQNNNQNGTASNQDDTLTNQQGRFISKFEASYQNEAFTVEHKYGSTAEGATTPAAGKRYTIDNDTNTYTTPEAGTYPIKHDLGNAFIGQFTTGQYFKLKETYGTGNKYVYTPVFSVWDQANNDKAVTYTGNNEDGYTFRFNPTTNVTTGIENTNIKARFENFMKAHSLTLTKKTNNPNDTESKFTMKIMFDFENDGNYIAYPLYCDLNGVRTQLSKTGEINIKAGQILEIEEIPENAKIQITELPLDNTSPYTYYGTDVTDMAGGAIEGGATAAPDGNGVRFTMRTNDIKVTVNNKQSDPVMISHNLKPGSVGDADTYVTAVVTDSTGNTTKETYEKTPGVIIVDPSYIKKGSTDKLVITLDTTPNGPYAFEHFWEQITNTMNQLAASGTPYEARIDEAAMTATVTIVIGELFNAQGVQLYTELPFYSSLQSYRYTVVFTYTSRLWQDQTYTTKGFFTAEELDKYVDHIDETDGIVMKTAETNSPRDEFIQKKAPYEDNFKQTVSWILKDQTNENPSGVRTVQNTEDHEIVLYITGMNTSNTTIPFKMNLPFAYTATDEGMVYTGVNEDGSVNYDATQPLFERETAFEQLYSLNNDRTPSNACFVQAPESVNNNGVVKHFSYWNVYDYENTTLIRRCYSRKFNLAFYEPYYIVPIYNEPDHISSQASQAKQWEDNREATIHFLENSRNQWNLGGGNKVSEVDTDWLEYGDRLFSDFVVEYRYNNKLISSFAPEDNVKTGIVIERVQELADTENGKDTDLSRYADVTGAADQGVDTVKTYVNNNFRKINDKALLKSEINYTDLDNKNMREIYYGFANIYQADQGVNAGNPTTLKNYLYRAYAYIKVGDDPAVVSQPAYFTIYDMASIECYYDNPTAGGGMS